MINGAVAYYGAFGNGNIMGWDRLKMFGQNSRMILLLSHHPVQMLPLFRVEDGHYQVWRTIRIVPNSRDVDGRIADKSQARAMPPRECQPVRLVQ
jgi:hypothetical protein